VPVTIELTPSGAFDLGQSANFGFGQRDAVEGTAEMHLAFVLDGYAGHAGVHARQRSDGVVSLTISDTQQVDVAADQAARVLSIDVDALDWDDLGRRDALIGELQAARPGLRPPLFYSAYEAAAWAVLSARRPLKQMVALRERLSTDHGAVLDVGGQLVAAFPTPAQLLAVREFPGLPPLKLDRLHGVARAALDGRLETADLRAMEPATAMTQLTRLEGVGPFYAELITIRALGKTDVAPTSEPKLLATAGQLLGAEGPLTSAELEQHAQRWRPWRTWACVAIRAAGQLVIDRRAAQPVAGLSR
jgi:DNA-3-methyladenine glycosylase II